MNSRFKKFLSLLMAFALILQYSVSLTVFAEDTNDDSAAVAAAEEAPKAEKAEKTEKAEQPKATEEQKDTASEAAPAEKAESESKSEDNSAPAESEQTDDVVQNDDSGESAAPDDTSADESVSNNELADAEDAEEDTELDYPAVTLTGAAGGVSVTINAPEGSLPEGVKMVVTAVAAGQVESAVEDAIGGEAGAIKAVDISFRHEGKEIEPKKAVSVKLNAKGMDAEAEKHVVHIDDSGNATKLADSKVDASGNKVEFSAKDFSIYVVVDEGEEAEDARLTVNFVQADGNTVAMEVTKKQVGDIETYIYDPGIGTVPDGAIFKGWSDDENYTADSDSMTIAGIRDAVKSKLNDGVKEGDEVTYYAMTFYKHTVTYLDEKSVTVKTDLVLYRTDDEAEQEYTVNLSYTPYVDDDEEEGAGTAEFIGWQQLVPETSEKVVYKNGDTIKISVDYTLFADVEDGHWLSFNENLPGATYTQPQFVTADSTPTEPAAPTCAGYTFDGWYTADATDERDGKVSGEKVDFGSFKLEKNTTVYAKWTENTEAKFTVLVWEESLSGGYDFVKSIDIANAKTGDEMSKIISATAGASTITVNGQSVFIGLASDSSKANAGFTYKEYTTNNDGIVTSDGTSVLNVYFDRREYTLKFYYYRTSGRNVYVATSGASSSANLSASWSSVSSAPSCSYSSGTGSETIGSYTYYYYSITAKYGASIADKWPAYANFGTAGSYNLISWIMMDGAAAKGASTGGEATVKGILTSMDEQVLGNLSSSTGNYLVARFSSSYNNWNYKIWFEQLDGEDYSGKTTKTYNGKKYYLEDTIIVRSQGNDASSQHAPAYPGHDSNGNGSVSGSGTANNPYVIDYYYSPKTYSILFMDGVYQTEDNPVKYNYSDNTLGEVNGIAYGADVSSYKSYKETDLQKDMHNYIFLGWYADSSCTELYNFDKMPEGGITVYAKWQKKDYEVNLHNNADGDSSFSYTDPSQKEQFYVENGDKVGNVGGERNNYDLVGWYADESFSKPYDFDLFTLNDDVIKTLGKLYSDSEIDPKWPNTVGQLNLYAKWRSKLIGANGINVVYDANGGTNPPTDDHKYTDLAEAVAGAAATSADDDKVFSHWAIQKWNEDSKKYEDSGETVYPGDTFEVKVEYAKVENVTPTEEDPSTKKYTVQLKAVYIDKDKETPTHIYWYKNDGTAGPIHTDPEGYPDGDEQLENNENVGIQEAQTRTGYEFKGWAKVNEPSETASYAPENISGTQILWYDGGKFYRDSDCSKEATAVAADEENPYEALIAVWEKSKYTVKYVDGVDDEVVFEDETHEDLTLDDDTPAFNNGTDPTRDGYTFDGWEPEVTDKVDIDNADDDNVITYTAKWKENAYTVIWMSQDGKTELEKDEDVALNTQPSFEGDTPTKKSTAQYTYTFAGWATSANQETGTAAANLPKVTEDVTYYAAFSKTVNKYTVTYNIIGTYGKLRNPDDGRLYDGIQKNNLEYGTATPAVEPVPNDGYSFAGWKKSPEDDAAVQDSLDPTVTENVTYYATWKPKTDTAYKVEHYQQNLNDDEFTLKETENLTGTTGSTVSATAKSYAGFKFDDSVDGTVKSGKVAADGSLVLKLYYTRNSYKVTYSYTGEVPDGAPEVPAEATYKYGATVPAATVPSLDDYTFDGWEGEVTTMPAKNVEVTGSWTAVEPDPEPTPDPDPTPTPVGPTDDDDDTNTNNGGGNKTTPTAAAVTPAPVAPAVIDDEPTPQAEPETIIDDPTPQAEPEGTWALINLLCAGLATVGAVLAAFRKKDEDDEEDDPDDDDDEAASDKRKARVAKGVGIAAAVASIVAFIITEDMSNPMALTDQWTLLMAVLFGGQAVTAGLTKKYTSSDDEEEDAE